MTISELSMKTADYSPLLKMVIEVYGSEYKYINGDEKRRMRLRRLKSGKNVTMDSILIMMEEFGVDDINKICIISDSEE